MKTLSFYSLLIFTILISSNLYSQDSLKARKHFADFKINDQYSDKKITNHVVLKDLDNDGDLDAVCANMGYNNGQVLFNDGKGHFNDSEQVFGDKDLSGIAVHLVDIDTDGDVDVVVEYNQSPDMLYKNNGEGYFTKSDITIPENPLFLILTLMEIWIFSADNLVVVL